MNATEDFTEAYAAKLADGSHVAIFASPTGEISVRHGRSGTPRRATAQQALEILLAGVGDSDWAMAGDGFPALRAAILRGLAGIGDAPAASRN